MTIALMVAAVLAWCWIALSCLPAGTEAHMPMPYLIALIPLLWVPLVALGALAAWFHVWGTACCLLAAAIASVLRRAQYRKIGRETPHETQISTRETQCETASDTLRVMTLNCRYGRADAGIIMRHIRERDIDVLALQEVTDALIVRLNEAGIRDTLPHCQTGTPHEDDNGGYNALFSRIEPAATIPNVVDIPAAEVPAMTLGVGGRNLTVASAHPKSPMRGCTQWSAGIRGLSALAARARDDERDDVAVMGDLNSSIEHPSFRALLTAGLSDASLAQGAGPAPTFPSWLKWPRIELDHVLFTRGVRASDVRPLAVAGSDHLALVATLSLPHCR
ncbi:endonuclease/exonuclease/phosphatase family protein [Bifidobacterium panos]|uniref:Endonuclease n=1 Tax=Bifidobacterium panos TaxID=2675321 RepID=A0ABX1SW14_9BIFI|nr:endonuclease/exonuclease/phosphatase family protein [Bifidobacterium sp. DSM 109963]NMN02041.1 endonuclease [Bifidobacterium sp. DSM 109963]